VTLRHPGWGRDADRTRRYVDGVWLGGSMRRLDDPLSHVGLLVVLEDLRKRAWRSDGTRRLVTPVSCRRPSVLDRFLVHGENMTSLVNASSVAIHDPACTLAKEVKSISPDG
jgi:hypothetical protein